MEKIKNFFTFDRHRIISLVISILLGLFFILLYTHTTLLNNLETGSIDFRFFIRDPSEASKEIMEVEAHKINPRANRNIVILAIDEASLAQIGAWPWPWGVHADLVKTLNLSSRPPKSILFDIFFIDHKKLFSDDADRVLKKNLSPRKYQRIRTFNKLNEKKLSKEISNAGNVFLDFPFFGERMKAGIPDMPSRIDFMKKISWPVHPDDETRPWVWDVTPPLLSISKGTAGIGFANIRYERGESVNRRMPLFVKFEKRYYPGINLLLAMDYFGVDRENVEIRPGDAIYIKKIPKILIPVENPEIFPKIIVEDKQSVELSMLLEYSFSGISKDDALAKSIGNPGFLTKVFFNVEYKDKIKIKNLEIRLVPQEDKESEGHLITQVKEFTVDKKKELSLGKGVLVAFKPSKNKKSLDLINNLGSPLEGFRTRTDIMARPNPERIIRIPIDEEGFMMINFAGGQESFPSYSYQMFVPKPGSSRKEINEHFETYKIFDSFDRKILMIAIYKALGLVDVHKSPYGPMFGIEHHANALNTILNQDFLSSLSTGQNILIMVLISLLLGFILARIPILNTAIISFLGVILYFILAQYIFNSYSLIYAVATPIIQVLITFSAVTVYRVMTEEQKSKYIKSTFSKFVSKTVVNELLSDPERLQLGGEDRVITIFFSDIRGFTTISEALAPQELVSLLNEYLSEMTDMIIDAKGTLDKYMGDAIMAFWGAPLPMEDHALRACKTSLVMMQRLNEMQEKWMQEGRTPINIGIGLNTGNATVGNMGSANRMDYTCMGDTINLGSRLEGINKVYTTNIIMSEYTYAEVKDRVYARELDLIKVKGKTKPVYIYELMGIKDDEEG